MCVSTCNSSLHMILLGPFENSMRHRQLHLPILQSKERITIKSKEAALPDTAVSTVVAITVSIAVDTAATATTATTATTAAVPISKKNRNIFQGAQGQTREEKSRAGSPKYVKE